MRRGRKSLPPGEALERKRARNRAWIREWAKTHSAEKREKNRLWAQKKRARQTHDERNAANRRAKAKDPIGYLLHHAKHRAAKQNLPFDLDRDSLAMPEVCPVLGLVFEWGEGQMGWRNMRAPSLDRIRPSLGYVRGNVQIISNRANHLKSNGTIAEFEAVLAYMKREGAHLTLDEQMTWEQAASCSIPADSQHTFSF